MAGLADLGIRPDVIEMAVNHASRLRGGIAGAVLVRAGARSATLTTPLENKCSGFIHSVAPRN